MSITSPRPSRAVERYRVTRMTSLPITSLLSQVLVALTIETDNEYEHRAPRSGGPWLTSTAMYVNFLRFVPPEGVRMAEVAANAGGSTPVHPAYHGMRRWGYVRYSPDIAGAPKARDGEAIVHLTPAGSHAQQTWRQVMTDIEMRWADRGLDVLRAALVPITRSIERPLPEFLSVLDYEFRRAVTGQSAQPPARRARLARAAVSDLPRDDVRLRSRVAAVARDVRRPTASTRIRTDTSARPARQKRRGQTRVELGDWSAREARTGRCRTGDDRPGEVGAVDEPWSGGTRCVPGGAP